MKKMSIFVGVVFMFCLFVFNSCGLDNYYVLEAPDTTYNKMQVNSGNCDNQTAYDLSYFDFSTNDSGQKITESFNYQGTAVYYRIYNNYSVMNDHISRLSALGSSTNVSAAASKMIDLKYRQLGLAVDVNGDGSRYVQLTVAPLIKAGSNNRRVYIRLSNNQNSEYRACIKITEVSDANAKFWMYKESNSSFATFDTVEAGYAAGYGLIIPYRNGNELNFDFGRKYVSGKNAGTYVVPAEGDDDVEYSSSLSHEGMWYVTMYAVAEGYDEAFTSYYSNVLYLGSVGIDAREEHN